MLENGPFWLYLAPNGPCGTNLCHPFIFIAQIIFVYLSAAFVAKAGKEASYSSVRRKLNWFMSMCKQACVWIGYNLYILVYVTKNCSCVAFYTTIYAICNLVTQSLPKKGYVLGKHKAMHYYYWGIWIYFWEQRFWEENIVLLF